MPVRKVVWSPVELEYLQKHKSNPVNQLCIALAKSRYAVKSKLSEIKSGKVPAKKKKTIRSKIGKRPDLGNLFMRSSWEADFLRVLKKDKTIKHIEYESTDFTFWQFGIKKGTVSYTPDFKVTFRDGSHVWIEVKGWMKAQDKTKIRRFKKYYPNEFKNLMAVTGSSGTKATQFFNEQGIPIYAYYSDLKKQYKKVIKNWEG